MMDSTTFEEANTRVGNWIRQRSRWIKGYMQTWLVHNAPPVPALARTSASAPLLGFQRTVGGTPFVLLLNPLFWLMTSSMP